MKLLRLLLGQAVFGLLTVVLGSVVIVVGPWERRKRMTSKIVSAWAGTLFPLTLSPVPRQLTDTLPGTGPYILMANHQSHIDVALLLKYAGVPIRFVAKKELLYVPVFGLAMWAAGHIPIDRRNREHAIQSLKAAAKRIRDGANVLVFPEGTRNQNPDGELLPFKKGGFMLALEAGVPIVPIGIAGTAERLPPHRLIVNPGPVCFRVGKPIPTAGRGPEARDALMQEVRDAITAERDRARRDLRAYEAKIQEAELRT